MTLAAMNDQYRITILIGLKVHIVYQSVQKNGGKSRLRGIIKTCDAYDEDITTLTLSTLKVWNVHNDESAQKILEHINICLSLVINF